MKNMKKEGANQQELTKEMRILAYLDEGLTWQQICHELHVSPSKISKAVKKRDGTYVPDDKTKDNNNSEKYSEMYTLFLEGKMPHEVAIALNLPMDYVQKHYVFYLNSVGLEGAVKLYKNEKDEGVKTLQNIRSIMKKFGNSVYDLKSVEAFATYTYDVHIAGRNLTSLTRECNEKSKEKLAEIKAIQDWKEMSENEKRRCEEWSTRADAACKKYNDFIADIERLKRENPLANAYRAARAGAKIVLNDQYFMIRLAFQAVINAIDRNIWLQWYFLPRTRPAELCYNSGADKRVKESCEKALIELANAHYDRLIDEAINRGGYIRKIS
jgi:hypothetical protein